MTLVAGAIHGGGITLVGDTKLTDDDDAVWSSDLYTNACVKIVLLRDDLAVGVSGDKAVVTIERLLKIRRLSADTVIYELQYNTARGDFLVASLNPTRLVKVRGCQHTVKEIAPGTLVGVGDMDAFDWLENFVHATSEDSTIHSRMRDGMQQLVHIGSPFPSVGGYPITARSTAAGFRFLSRGFAVGPEAEVEAALSPDEDLLVLTVTAPAGPSDWHAGWVLPGAEPTPLSIGLHFDEAGVGLLFPQDTFHDSIEITDVPRPWNFARKAAADLGHTLQSPVCVDDELGA